MADKVAVVTGAGSGIGRAVAVRLAEEGATVVVTSRTPDHVAETSRIVERETGVAPLSFQLDVSDQEHVRTVVESIVAEIGRIDVLSNNAGIELLPLRPVESTDDQDWEKVVRVNLTGTFYMCRAVLPHMSEGGSIINTSSIQATVAFPNDAAYAATKGALLQFTRALALEVGSRGIRANCVNPGVIDTPLTHALHQSSPDPEEAKDWETRLSPFRRMGDPREVANCVLFLASEDASFVTGAALVVDGGATATTGPSS